MFLIGKTCFSHETINNNILISLFTTHIELNSKYICVSNTTFLHIEKSEFDVEVEQDCSITKDSFAMLKSRDFN